MVASAPTHPLIWIRTRHGLHLIVLTLSAAAQRASCGRRLGWPAARRRMHTCGAACLCPPRTAASSRSLQARPRAAVLAQPQHNVGRECALPLRVRMRTRIAGAGRACGARQPQRTPVLGRPPGLPGARQAQRAHLGGSAELGSARRAGDSHSVALAADGAVWAWGTFRDASGVYGFSPSQRIALLPALVHAPASAAERVVKVASGAGRGPARAPNPGRRAAGRAGGARRVASRHRPLSNMPACKCRARRGSVA